MAVKSDGRYYAYILHRPHIREPEWGPELAVKDDGRFDAMDCKYCYTDDVKVVSSYEEYEGESFVQALCASCGAGLSEPELISS